MIQLNTLLVRYPLAGLLFFCAGTLPLTTGCSSGGGEAAAILPIPTVVKSWSTPQQISRPNGNTGAHDIDMDASGNAIVVSRDFPVGITAMHYINGSGWQAPVIITAAGSKIDNPHIAVAPDGNAVAIHHREDSSGEVRVWGARYFAGVGWDSEAFVQTGRGIVPAAPLGVVIDSNSNAVAVWREGVAFSPFNIFANTYSSVSGWSPLSTEIDNMLVGGDTASNGDVSNDSVGDTYVVMQQRNTGLGEDRIYFNRHVNGLGWGAAELVSTFSGSASTPRIAVDGNRNAISIWSQADGGSTSLYASRRPAGGTWQLQEPIETAAGDIGTGRALAMNSSGAAFAIWVQDDGSSTSAYANRYTPANGWETARLLENSNEAVFDVDIAVDTNGNAYAVWSQESPDNFRIYRRQYTVAGGWGVTELMENDVGKRASSPRIVFDGDGNAIAVWRLSDPAISGVSRVWASRYE